MNRRFEMLLSSVIGVAAICTAGVAVHREFFSPLPITRLPPDKPTYYANWRDLIPTGTTVGRTDAAITIVEFADIECPFCRIFKASYDTLKSALGDSVALVFIHYPIPGHRFAVPGARALECANAESRFGPLIGEFYQRQDSLGLKSWTAYALDAGIRDTIAFQRCISKTDPVKRADAGVALGRKLGVHGTPTVYINGWRFSSALVATDLKQVVADIRNGKEPSLR